MALGLQQTKTRIRSVASTKKITKAMELVATSKLKTSKKLNSQLQPFKNKVFDIVSCCASKIDDKDSIYFKENDASKSLHIVITSSLGLCGGYNINIEKYIINNISNNDDIVLIGSKGYSYFKEKGFNIVYFEDQLPNMNVKEKISSMIAIYAHHRFLDGKYKNIDIVYTRFINSLTFEPTRLQLLPITNLSNVTKSNKELLLEPSAEEVLSNIVPFYLQTSIKSMLFESMLSEQASRRTAMENATDNASELEEKLLLEFNKSRQAAITQEITEISGAANAQR